MHGPAAQGTLVRGGRCRGSNSTHSRSRSSTSTTVDGRVSFLSSTVFSSARPSTAAPSNVRLSVPASRPSDCWVEPSEAVSDADRCRATLRRRAPLLLLTFGLTACTVMHFALGASTAPEVRAARLVWQMLLVCIASASCHVAVRKQARVLLTPSAASLQRLPERMSACFPFESAVPQPPTHPTFAGPAEESGDPGAPLTPASQIRALQAEVARLEEELETEVLHRRLLLMRMQREERGTCDTGVNTSDAPESCYRERVRTVTRSASGTLSSPRSFATMHWPESPGSPPDGRANTCEDWVMGKTIWRGPAGCTVRRGLSCSSGVPALIKCAKDSDRGADLASEAAILAELKHPNIVSRLVYIDREQLLVKELGAVQSLRVALDEFGAIREPILPHYVRQLCSAVSFIHQQGVVLGCLMAESILLSAQGVCKVSDFSKAFKVSSGASVGIEPSQALWLPPEVLQGGGCGWASDVWSLGATTFELLTTRPPHCDVIRKHPDVRTALSVLAQLGPPDVGVQFLSPAGQEFVRDCFEVVGRRKSAEALSCHRWFSGPGSAGSDVCTPNSGYAVAEHGSGVGSNDGMVVSENTVAISLRLLSKLRQIRPLDAYLSLGEVTA
eukprot:TRINITY_DN16765_c0_g1_i1.p1 TRINITY_DN16765_c0_g1~~TRINITY_DN16765_c0_g1_i1.p1  ORF type:complete len:616 (+),score=92.13 TRINITY_DN16765_c0_g1_i1:52-1899(+)